MKLRLPSAPRPPVRSPEPVPQVSVGLAPKVSHKGHGQQHSQGGLKPSFAVEEPSYRDPEFERESGWEFDFAEAVPGALGEFIVAKPYDEDSAPYRRTNLAPAKKESEPPVQPRKKGPGVGTRIADSLVTDFEAAPATFFHGRHYTTRNLAAYLSGSSVLRAEAFRAPKGDDLTWGDMGWTRDHNRVLLVLISEIRDKLRDNDGSFTAVLLGIKDERVRQLYEAAFRAGMGAGLLSALDWPQRSAPVDWPTVSSSLLAMRLFTEEQVSYLVPNRNLAAIKSSIQAWLRQGYVRPHPGVFPLDVYRLTPKGASTVVEAGLVSEEEAEKRLVIRRSQELHDLAVGDALVLAAMEIEEKGGQVVEVINEMRLIAEGNAAGVSGEAYPDFVMKYALDGVETKVGVEVVGIGNNYRTAAKRSKVSETGFKLLDPGFTGGGFRYA